MGKGLLLVWHHRQVCIVGSLNKRACKEVCVVKPGIDLHSLLARLCNRWWPDFVSFTSYKKWRLGLVKGSLSSSWMNSPIPSLLLPLWQNESLCKTIDMKIWCHSHENQVIFMIFTGNVLHKHSPCKWKLRRWKSKSAYTLFCFMRMLFFWPRLNILISRPILAWKHSCIILKL